MKRILQATLLGLIGSNLMAREVRHIAVFVHPVNFRLRADETVVSARPSFSDMVSRHGTTFQNMYVAIDLTQQPSHGAGFTITKKGNEYKVCMNKGMYIPSIVAPDRWDSWGFVRGLLSENTRTDDQYCFTLTRGHGFDTRPAGESLENDLSSYLDDWLTKNPTK
jgi:hypothetical protein